MFFEFYNPLYLLLVRFLISFCRLFTQHIFFIILTTLKINKIRLTVSNTTHHHQQEESKLGRHLC